MSKHLLKILSLASIAFWTIGATTHPEGNDTLTIEDVTVPAGIPYDFIVSGEGNDLGTLGTHETSGVGSHNVVVEPGADSIWWAQDRIVLRPGTKIERQSNNGFVWLAVDEDWDGFSDREEAEGVDYDGDGLPDGWEADYNINSSGAGDDNDNDGIPNIVEFYFETNPTSTNATNSSVSVSIF